MTSEAKIGVVRRKNTDAATNTGGESTVIEIPHFP